MDDEQSDFKKIDDRCGANVEGDAGAAGAHLKIPVQNWTWAHYSDSYDWMDWHTPCSAASSPD
jgi:hypothetical protein